jgi:hypothetical protein
MNIHVKMAMNVYIENNVGVEMDFDVDVNMYIYKCEWTWTRTWARTRYVRGCGRGPGHRYGRDV